MSSPAARRIAPLAVGVACVAAVTTYGELSLGALIAVAATGAAVVWVGLARRAGEAVPPVGRRRWPWLAWLTGVVAWEVVTLTWRELSTASDLLDPVLSRSGVRGAATAVWLAAGLWLVLRPGRASGAL